MGQQLGLGNKKQLILSLVGVVGGLYTFYRYRASRIQKDTDTKNNRYQNGQSDYQSQLDKENEFMTQEQEWGNRSTQTKSGKIEQITSQIKVSYIPNSEYLEPATIVQILQLSVELASTDYVTATQKNRKNRRQAKSNNMIAQYQKLILEYNEEIERILESAQAELLFRLEIHKDIFEESLLILLERGYFQQLYMLQASVKQKIKEKIPSSKTLNRNQIKDVIRYNIQILKERPEIFSKVIQKLQQTEETVQLVPMAINAIVSDYIFEKFGVEEEDQIRNLQLSDHMADSEIHSLLGQIEQSMQEYVGELGFGATDSTHENSELYIAY